MFSGLDLSVGPRVLMLSPHPHRQISDRIYRSNPETSAWSFHSLQYSITICPAVGFIGGLFYLVAVFYINDDRKAVLQFLEGRFTAQL